MVRIGIVDINVVLNGLTALLTKPVQAVGIEAEHSTIVKRSLAPYLSQSGPRRKRMKIVLPTPTMFDVQICPLVRFSVVLISPRRGAMENQMKNAIKKPHHEQWKARI